MALNISVNSHEPQEITMVIGDNAFSGKFLITSYNLDLMTDVVEHFSSSGGRALVPTLNYAKLSLEAISSGALIIGELEKPKIRNKKVNDCSIQELLYAIRQKTK